MFGPVPSQLLQLAIFSLGSGHRGQLPQKILAAFSGKEKRSKEGNESVKLE